MDDVDHGVRKRYLIHSGLNMFLHLEIYVVLVICFHIPSMEYSHKTVFVILLSFLSNSQFLGMEYRYFKTFKVSQR